MINFYEIDLEVLFSRTPFLLQKQSGNFDFVKPNFHLDVKILTSSDE